MHRDSITAQRGQGWLVSFAVLILVAAIAAVAFTVINSEKKQKPIHPVKTSAPSSLSEAELQAVAKKLVTKHLGSKEGSREEDIQALSNTLHNLQNHSNQAASDTLLLLKEDKLDAAIEALKNLALATQSKRNAAKLWVDTGNISTLITAQDALDAYQKAVTLDADNINAWNRIGHLERLLKRYDNAEIAYKNVTRLSDDLSGTQALSFANFGLLHQSQNKYDEAIESFSEALRINSKIQNNAGIASNNENLASLYRTVKKNDLAEKHYKAAFAIYESEKQTPKLIEIHSALGSLYQSTQKTALALSEYEKAMSLSQENPNKRFSAGLYSNMGILAQRNKDIDKAESYFQQSLALYQSIKQDKGTADQFSNLAILARNKKQFQESETLHLKAIDLYKQADLKQAITNQYINLGFLYTAWKKNKTACEYWNKSLAGLTGSKHQARKKRIEDILNRDCQAKPELTKPN